MRDRNPGRTINRLECKRLVDQGRGILCGRDQTIQINRLLRLFCQAVSCTKPLDAGIGSESDRKRDADDR